MVRYWLKRTATDEDVIGSESDLVISVDQMNHERFIEVNADPLDPTCVLPRILACFVSRVTFTQRFFVGLREEGDGIYKTKSATARLMTIIEQFSEPDGDIVTSICQEIAISAKSIRSLKIMYHKIRSGKIKPSESWNVRTDDGLETSEDAPVVVNRTIH